MFAQQTAKLTQPTLEVGKNLMRVENSGFLKHFPESAAAWFVG